MSVSLQRPTPALNGSAADSRLLCLLDDTLLGIEALAVREVLPLPLVTPLREAPPQVVGVVNVRGSLVPVVDVRYALGLKPQNAQLNDVLVVLERSGEFAAIIVSEVRDVRPLSARSLENGPMTQASRVGIVAGLATLGDDIVQLLRLETLLRLGEVSHELASNDRLTGDRLAGDRLTGDRLTGELNGVRSLFATVSPSDLEVFAARARALGRNLTGEIELQSSQSRLVAAFLLRGEFFGLDISVVREFSPLKSVSPVPCSPPYIAGLMNLRGETLTLIDIGPTLGLPPAPPNVENAKVVVTQCEGLRLGIVVDEVLDIISLNTPEVASLSSHPSNISDAEIVRGTIFFRDKMLGIIDLPRLLASDALAAGR